MKRKTTLLFLLMFFCACFLSPAHGEGDEWETCGGTAVKLGNRQYYTPVFTPQLIDGDYVSLPTGNPKGLYVRFVKDTIFVDDNGNGKADKAVVKKDSSKEFSVTLEYADGEKVSHAFIFYKRGTQWGLERQSGMKFTIGGQDVVFSDENNNGMYGEVGLDGVFLSGKNYGTPLGDLLFTGGCCYEVRLNGSGTEVKYRKVQTSMGKIDITSKWGGSKSPSCIVTKVKMKEGTGYFDLPSGSIDLPQASYQIEMAYLPDVEIDCRSASLSFSVSSGDANTAPAWGEELKLSVPSVSYDSKKCSVFVSPTPTVTDKCGAKYLGYYISNDKFKVKVRLADANGKPKGSAVNWGMSKTGSGGG